MSEVQTVIPLDADTLGGKTREEFEQDIELLREQKNTLQENLDKVKANLSNPNLLDNPWLTINQRGQSEYIDSDYCFDRWKFQNLSLSGAININEKNTVSITTKNNDGIFQILSKALEIGETYTISFNDGNTIYSKTFVWNGGNIVQLYDNARTVIFAIINGTQVFPYIRYEDTVATDNIVAVKLEKGSISTLAMDTVPNYALELIKCSMSTADPNDTYANKPNYVQLVSNFEVGVNEIVTTVNTISGAVEGDENYLDGSSTPSDIVNVLNNNLGNEFENGICRQMFYSNGSAKSLPSFKISKSGSYTVSLQYYFRSSLDTNFTVYKNGTLLKTFTAPNSYSFDPQDTIFTLNAGDVLTTAFTSVSGNGGAYGGIEIKLN